MYLLTFSTLTDAFKADVYLKDKYQTKIIHIPFSLSATCYGMGLSFEDENIISELNNFSYKKLWKETSENIFTLLKENNV